MTFPLVLLVSETFANLEASAETFKRQADALSNSLESPPSAADSYMGREKFISNTLIPRRKQILKDLEGIERWLCIGSAEPNAISQLSDFKRQAAPGPFKRLVSSVEAIVDQVEIHAQRVSAYLSELGYEDPEPLLNYAADGLKGGSDGYDGDMESSPKHLQDGVATPKASQYSRTSSAVSSAQFPQPTFTAAAHFTFDEPPSPTLEISTLAMEILTERMGSKAETPNSIPTPTIFNPLNYDDLASSDNSIFLMNQHLLQSDESARSSLTGHGRTDDCRQILSNAAQISTLNKLLMNCADSPDSDSDNHTYVPKKANKTSPEYSRRKSMLPMPSMLTSRQNHNNDAAVGGLASAFSSLTIKNGHLSLHDDPAGSKRNKTQRSSDSIFDPLIPSVSELEYDQLEAFVKAQISIKQLNTIISEVNEHITDKRLFAGTGRLSGADEITAEEIAQLLNVGTSLYQVGTMQETDRLRRHQQG
ncbi:hypothetical protein BJ742DRAFT_160131 [Cladochytrium replicatum]|nr:hypothetical protein BJ742DRAFT_160131 [Cladochytrium replicatum]